MQNNYETTVPILPLPTEEVSPLHSNTPASPSRMRTKSFLFQSSSHTSDLKNTNEPSSLETLHQNYVGHILRQTTVHPENTTTITTPDVPTFPQENISSNTTGNFPTHRSLTNTPSHHHHQTHQQTFPSDANNINNNNNNNSHDKPQPPFRPHSPSRLPFLPFPRSQREIEDEFKPLIIYDKHGRKRELRGEERRRYLKKLEKESEQKSQETKTSSNDNKNAKEGKHDGVRSRSLGVKSGGRGKENFGGGGGGGGGGRGYGGLGGRSRSVSPSRSRGDVKSKHRNNPFVSAIEKDVRVSSRLYDFDKIQQKSVSSNELTSATRHKPKKPMEAPITIFHPRIIRGLERDPLLKGSSGGRDDVDGIGRFSSGWKEAVLEVKDFERKHKMQQSGRVKEGDIEVEKEVEKMYSRKMKMEKLEHKLFRSGIRPWPSPDGF
jgi:hypothetical protein